MNAKFVYDVDDVYINTALLPKFYKDIENYNLKGFRGIKIGTNEQNQLLYIGLPSYKTEFSNLHVFSQLLSKIVSRGTLWIQFIYENCSIIGYKITHEKTEYLIPILICDSQYNQLSEGTFKLLII